MITRTLTRTAAALLTVALLAAGGAATAKGKGVAPDDTSKDKGIVAPLGKDKG